ncbi:MAG TPA: DNA recombination protein RmuC [Gaiellaceae bacterium]|nr:DNA recombination protein RmuC [Gaiellaceae bacterium]
MTALVGILVLAAALVGALAWLVRATRSGQDALGAALGSLAADTSGALTELRSETARQLVDRNAEVDRRLGTLAETLDRRLGQLDGKVDRRLEAAQRTTTEIHERLGKVDSAAVQMLERAKDLSRLEQALRPPKARGGFGELLLENLLRDRLPASAFQMQYGFSTGERVDAIVRGGSLLIPIDSKFPLDNYQRIVEASSDDERQLAEKAFARDVRAHVDAIAAKYVRPDEGTSDFAFMYIPVEAVYYELACGKTASTLQYAHEQRVFPMSPSTFTAYLQVIAFGLRGMQIEQRAHEVMAYVADLTRDFEKFQDDFELVGKHLGNAQSKFVSADKRLDKFAGKLERASEEAEVDEIEGDVDEPPFAIEAA